MSRCPALLLALAIVSLIAACAPANRELRNEVLGISVSVPVTYDVEQFPVALRLSSGSDQIRIFRESAWTNIEESRARDQLLAAQAKYLLSVLESPALRPNPEKAAQLESIQNSDEVHVVRLGTNDWFFFQMQGTPTTSSQSQAVYGTICNGDTIIAVQDTQARDEGAELQRILSTFECFTPPPDAVQRYLQELANDLNQRCWNTGCYAPTLRWLERGLLYCDQALAIYAEAGPVLDSRAFVLQRMGRIDEAITLYEQAVALDPSNEEHQAHLECAQRQRENPDDPCADGFCV